MYLLAVTEEEIRGGGGNTCLLILMYLLAVTEEEMGGGGGQHLSADVPVGSETEEEVRGGWG